MNTIFCQIRKKEVNKTPEEIVRQNFIEELVEVYGYDVENMKVEYYVKSSPSDSNKSFPVDLVVFDDNRPKIFVETKKEDEDLNIGHISQLENYMSFDSHVRWGILTNGKNKIFKEKIIKNNKIGFVDCFGIPKNGHYSIEEEIKLIDLRKQVNLKNIFKNIRAHVATNAVGITRDETIASEIIKLILCKTYDEKFTPKNDFLSFHVYDNNINLTYEAISKIYENVLDKYDEVFDSTDKIELDQKSVFYIVNQLQNIYLTSSERNVISDAFETIIGDSLKGSQGQFFTPKNVVKLIVQLIKPTYKDKILDPACGSGSFLMESILYVWNELNKKNMSDSAIFEEQKDYCMKRVFGIEKDNFLAQICKSYMAVLGDGKSGIVVDDSLSYPTEWKSSNIQLNNFDMILTNPPFGKEIKLTKHTAKQYKSNKVDIAFLERSLDLLNSKGKIAIVLSEVIFHAPSYKKFRKAFFYKNNIKALIDLPHDTFRPYNNAKCIVIILEKTNDPTEQDEYIQMIKINEIGHDHTGKLKYIYDFEKHESTDILNDDIPLIINDLNENKINSKFIKFVKSKKAIDEDILVPRYYFDDQDSIEYDKTPYKYLKDLVEEGVVDTFKGHGSPKSIYKGKGDVPYIRVKDIVNHEVYINPLDKIPLDYANMMKNKKFKRVMKEGDIVFVRRGSYRIGDVGQLHKKDLNSIFTGELQFFHVNENNKYGLTNHNLFLLFNSKEILSQFDHLIFIDTTLPTIGDRWNKLKIPIYPLKEMDTLNKKGKKLFNLRKKYWEELKKINF